MERKIKITFGFLLIIISTVVIAISSTFPEAVAAGKRIPGPGFFPTLIGIALIIGGIYQIKEGLKTRDDESKKIECNWGTVNIVLVVISLIVYSIVMQWLGYALSTLIFSIPLMIRLKAGKVKAVFFSIFITIFIVLVFGQVFKIQLPMGTLGLPW